MPVIDIAQTGEKIRNIQKQCGMTAKDMAEACGISPAAVCKWGKTCVPSIDNLVVIAHICGVTIDQIIVVK